MPPKFRELAKMLRAADWKHDHTTGSHYIYVHPTKGSVSVPFHGDNKEIAPGTLKAILKQSGLS
jgi:predicted RNA binding protein YcfA (HicA-like mRNA interferase family)